MIRRFSARVIAGRTREACAVRCVDLIACRINPINVRLHIPVMHHAARCSKELALLLQEICRLPACTVALQHMFFRVKAALCIILIDRDLRFRLLTDHHAPDDPPLCLRHPA